MTENYTRKEPHRAAWKTRRLGASFRAAYHGFWHTLRHETSFKYMVAAALAVVAGMIVLRTSRQENVALLTMIFAVLGLELVNTAFEHFLDYLNPEHDERIRVIKDVLATIVLVAALGAAIIGAVIFLPHLAEPA